MKIIDSFIFYNELDLLFYRLSILDEYVDTFILVESTHTFSGHSKPLFFMENIERFSKFIHKIIHIVVTDCPFKFPYINYEWNQQWENEYHQRNCIKRGLDSILNNICDDDILLTSDVDEIPNPFVLKNTINGILIFDANTLNRLALDMYYYNLYYRIGQGSNWHGIKLMTIYAYKNMGLSFQQMRLWEHSYYVPIIANGGWHLSYFGDIDFIVKKIVGFSHQEYNKNEFIDKDILEKNIKNGINLLNHSELVYIPIEENTNLPYQYDIYLKNFYTSNTNISLC
jgi:beta-1,4-mannosyl-glycoprotein beta-1,4-N-acetylglucosaminyltransferase